MPTIKDVADASGYSVCTVSRALSGKGYLKDTTKQKIMEAVKEIGYQPNRTAVSLKTGRTNALALIVPDITNSYFTLLEKYIGIYAGYRGYMVYLCNTDNNLDREKNFIMDLSCGRVDGVIIIPCSLEHDHIKDLAESRISYVYLNRDFEDDVEHCLRIDNEKGGYECVKYLIDNGYRRIGGIFQSFGNTSYRERFEGMKRALKEGGVSYYEDLCLFHMDDLYNAHSSIRVLISIQDRPEALFCANDMLAFEAYQAAYENDLHIPDDLSVVGFDNSFMSDRVVPKLTTYYQPAKECAHEAIDYITAEIEHRPIPDLGKLEGRLIERNSVKRKSGAGTRT